MRLVIAYAAFAALAVLANLGVQRLVLGGSASGARLAAALVAGTLAGMALKYLLDRRWIFRAAPLGPAAEGRRVGRYAGTGILTTLVFWGAEVAAFVAWGTPAAREAGALAGLGLGYALKYRLDRAWVFAPAEVRA